MVRRVVSAPPPPWLTASLCLLAAAVVTTGCPRSPTQKPPPDRDRPANAGGPSVCVEQPDGCVFCAGRDEGVFLEPDQSRPLLCDPADDENCVEFCSTTTPDCALPWRKTPTCVRASDLEFRRALFNLRTADRPESVLQGKVVDEAGKRIEGASVRVWLSWGAWPGLVPLVDEVTGKDGGLRIPLRSGPWSYSVRIAHPEHATSIVDRLPAERLEKNGPRTFRLFAGQTIRGKIVDQDGGLPVAGALIHAVRTPEDVIVVADTTSAEDGTFTLGGLEVRRYVLNVSRFAWRQEPAGVVVAAPAQKVTLKMVQANVIRGVVLDADGVAEPSATVAAVLASSPGVSSPPIVWTTDGDGRFAQDHFVPGTYYLWARRGDMLAYPPSRIELLANQVVDVRMTLGHKGTRVVGTIELPERDLAPGTVSVELVARYSPLSFPRNPVAKVDGKGAFTLTGVLPGRYRFAPRSGIRGMQVIRGPREIEIPVEPGRTITVDEPLVLRTRIEE
jgi:hypothetical protein